ncbi:hypothetical protein ACRS85_18840 [Pluralibacter gergoviae]|uniref:hypothetical protein n=1 Tax=Pluralibacter gergoviae TaxID=61647 RepID=UPI003EE0D7E9
MKLSMLLFTFLMLILSKGVFANNKYSADILNHLDVSTFRNSLQPKSPNPGDTVRTFGYNIELTTNKGESYTLTNNAGSCKYSVKFLNYNKNKKIYTICFYDIASPPATYNGSLKLSLKKIKEKYVSITNKSIIEKC